MRTAQDDDNFGSDSEEEEDKPKKKQKKSKKGDGDDDDDLDTEKEVNKANYSRIESAEGGLIKTRTQRALEEQQATQYRSVSGLKSNVDVDALWKNLQALSQERLKHRFSSTSPSPTETPQPLISNEKIKIKRKYEFAGEIVTEDKWVDRESAEAREYLQSIKNKPNTEIETQAGDKSKEQEQQQNEHSGKKLRIKRKRPPLLEGIISGAIKPKFNTLEKSKLDFAQFVDKEGIDDELRQHNKDGYLERQDFLSRVEFFKDSQIKEMRKKELINKNK